MTFDMDKLIKRPLIDNQSFYVDHISELAEESFIDMCSDDPLENALTVIERDIFSIDNNADEFACLMNASEEVIRVD